MTRFVSKWHLAGAFLLTSSLFAQEPAADRKFDYDGSFFFQGFYVNRDLPLNIRGKTNPPDTSFPYDCPVPLNPAASPGVTNVANGNCRDNADFYRARFRLNLAFRPSAYVDVKYGLEVGPTFFGQAENTFGNIERKNLKTREMIMKVHTADQEASVSVGVFTYSTPKGLVLASSGAGFKFNLSVPDLYSDFEAVYIRAEDRSRINDDSQGFSSQNFKPIQISLLDWKYSGLRWLRSEMYALYREDKSTSVEDNDGYETSRVAWGGLFLQFRWTNFSLILHGVGNWGSFDRPLSVMPPESNYAGLYPTLQPYYDQINANPSNRRRRTNVNAGAGQTEFIWYASDQLQFSAVAAGASGRPEGDIENNGGQVTYRRDQFRTAVSGFQMTHIAVDNSGGYTIFNQGRLTGIFIRGALGRIQIYESLQLEVGYYTINLMHVPTIDYNVRFTRYSRDLRPTSYLGEEWNTTLTWRIWSNFTVDMKAAFFQAGDAYKILKDVNFGRHLTEVSMSANQNF